MGSPSKTASTIVLGSGETGYDRWARSSQQIGAYYASPKKPTTPGRAPGTAALIGRANRASAAMRVLGSTMGYDTNPPPPVAVTMLGKRTHSDHSLYLTLGHSQNMYKSASGFWEASVTRASRALPQVAERPPTDTRVTFEGDRPSVDVNAEPGEDAPLSPTLDEHAFGETPLSNDQPGPSFGIEGADPPDDGLFEEASVDVLTVGGDGSLQE